MATDTFNHIYFTGSCWAVDNPNLDTPIYFHVAFGNLDFPSNVTSDEFTLVIELDTAGNTLCGSAIPIGGDDNSGIAVDPSGKYVYQGSDYFTFATVVIGPDTLNNPPNQYVSEVNYLVRWQPCNTAPFSYSINSFNITCNAADDGSATVTATGGTGPYSYKWSNGQTTASDTGLAAGTYFVTITYSLSDTIIDSVTILAGQSVMVNVTSGSTICAEQTDTLRATGALVYSWWPTDGLSDSTGSTVIASPTVTTAYRVTGVSGNCSDTASTLVTVNPLPVPPVLSTGDSEICASDSTLITTSGSYTSYLWNNGDTLSSIYVKSAGGYWVTVTDAAGCSAVSNHQYIATYPSPPVSIEVYGDTLNALNAVSYQWYLNDSVIPGATFPQYIAKQTGYYSIEITDTNRCNEFSNSFQVIVNSLEELTGGRQFSIYPNPADKFVVVNLSSEIPGAFLRIYNSVGQLMVSANAQKEQLILLNRFPSGIYYIKIQSPGFIESKTFSVIHNNR